jgi:hypothetical protein
MRKIVLLVVLALAAIPAAYADNSPTPTQQASAMCKQQRTAIGATFFTQLYGGGKNAYGRCVSKLASTVSGDKTNASKQCAAERADATFATSHGGKTFDQFYGTTNKSGKSSNAFGKCVSSKAKAQEQQQQQTTVNAAKSCKAEFKSLGATDFKTKYGGHSNAFGKCVSKTAKASSP